MKKNKNIFYRSSTASSRIIFESGAREGYGRWIDRHLAELRTLQRENPVEHDALIASNRYSAPHKLN